jgi:hypothetical protein
MFGRCHDIAANARIDLDWHGEARFMDDILILAPTHWQLRRAVKVVNQMLGALGLEKHPDKTFIGRIERGFDFLGLSFQSGWAGHSQADNHELYREGISAL